MLFLEAKLIPESSITNFIGGKVVDPLLPPITATTWVLAETGESALRDEIDENGCIHYDMRRDTRNG